MVSANHCVCAKGYYVVSVSTSVETENPEEEIQPALNLLGSILEIFVTVTDNFAPLDDGKENNLWITKSYDSSSHFEMAS